MVIYQYDLVGTYNVSLTMTESTTGKKVTDTKSVKAIEVEPPPPTGDFTTVINGPTVTLTAILPAEIMRAYIYWGDRVHTVSTNPQADLATGISHNYARIGRTYNIRVTTIDAAHHMLDYTFNEDGNLSVALP
jgi:hypothetical protein